MFRTTNKFTHMHSFIENGSSILGNDYYDVSCVYLNFRHQLLLNDLGYEFYHLLLDLCTGAEQ